MPGYDKSRFINLTKNESQQLSCGICLAILRDPRFTKCCEQAYCLECIEQWLLNSETCPNDRKTLTKGELCNVPKFVRNMFLEMEISCSFIDLGCKKIVYLEVIENHEANCKFNPQAICQDCFSQNGELSEHNCISNFKRQHLKCEQTIKELTIKVQASKSQHYFDNYKLKLEINNKEKELGESKECEKVSQSKIDRLLNESRLMRETFYASQEILQKKQDRIKILEGKLKSGQNNIILFEKKAMSRNETMRKSLKSMEKTINDNEIHVQNSVKILKSQIFSGSREDPDDDENLLDIESDEITYDSLSPYKTSKNENPITRFFGK